MLYSFQHYTSMRLFLMVIYFLIHFIVLFIAYPTVCDDCHPNAECVQDQYTQEYRCVCSAGYQGDGTRCEPYDCRQADLCDPNARCGQDSQGFYVCRCNQGYRGIRSYHFVLEISRSNALSLSFSLSLSLSLSSVNYSKSKVMRISIHHY